MRKIILFALVANMGFFGQNVYAQDISEETETQAQKEFRDKQIKERIEYLNQKKADAIEYEKNQLKGRVSYINRQLEKGKITAEEAEVQKKEIATYIAKNIDYKTTIIDTQIALVERNGVQYQPSQVEIGFGGEDEDGKRVFGIAIDNGEGRRKVNHHRRTRSDFVFAFGLNNALADGRSLEDSPYKVAGSRFAELGVAWTTRVFENSGWLRFKYGFSFQFNGLKPTDNRIFVREGDQVVLQEFENNLDKSKLRLGNLVVPVHFEFGPSKRKGEGEDIRFSTHNKFKIGVGGYAGLNLGTMQKLKFDNGEGNDVKLKQRGGFNTNSFVYGLSGYLGYDNVGLYVKYDLNPIFKDNLVEERNISLGLRFDLD
ncbi:hypothetical protein ACFO3O_03075 [Dokdonia ponticola]|uniref:PorT family protein n=1 Tax=Dokdonia ponticola TaxID=2041041 RepID=A0ABV9HTE0_9FLAO